MTGFKNLIFIEFGVAQKGFAKFAFTKLGSYEFLKSREQNDDITKKLLNLFQDEVDHFRNEEN